MKKALSAPPCALVKDPSTENMGAIRNVVYGTSKGGIGRLGVYSNKLKTDWKTTKNDTGAAINCIALHDITQDGKLETLVGRNDGTIQVYAKKEDGAPVVIYEHVEPESIRSITCGIVSTPSYEEILACTYTGRVVSYTSEPLNNPDVDDSYGRSRGTVQRESRIMKLRKEVDKLKEKVFLYLF